MSDVEKTYQQGVIDGVQLYGEACSKQGTCETCPIGQVRGAGVTCQEFAKQFPAKMVSLLKEMNEGTITYYNEYCMRFPNSTLPVDILSQCCCRKAIFEGDLTCECDDDERCVACWNEVFTGDVTTAEE